MSNTESKASSFKATKEQALQCAVYHRGPCDTSGMERDREWRKEVRSARGWAALAEALPMGHKMRSTIALRAGW